MGKLFKISVFILGTILLFASCSSKTYRKINYLQDIQKDTAIVLTKNTGIIVQPQDMISIVVSSRNPELSAMYNLVNISYQAGGETEGSYNRLLGYVVNNEGDIDFPILGKLHVAGLNRWEVAQMVKNKLKETGQLKDPNVAVEFMNFRISVLGEVSRPGTYSISGDKINLLEALSMAGDLTIYGRRDRVKVVREQNGLRNIYVVDLRSSDLFTSPAFYLKQNDEIYVEPNSVRAGQSTINENNFRSVGFWASISTTLFTIANIIITISNSKR